MGWGRQNNRRFPHGILYDAIELNHNAMEIVQLLLEDGFHPNKCENQNGRTPLHIIARLGQIDMYKIFLSYGATPKRCKIWNGLLSPCEYAQRNLDEMTRSQTKVPNDATKQHIQRLKTFIKWAQEHSI